MYEEGNRKLSFNGLSLAIKLAILAVVVFLLCWIFTKVNASNNTKTAENNTEYINNITAMKEAAIEYFTTDKLPATVGGTQKLTLSQMVDRKLLIDFTNQGDKCNLTDSYIQATKTADGDYALKVSLNCGKTQDFIVTTIEKTKCIIENNCPPTDNNLADKDDNNNDKVTDDEFNDRDDKDNIVKPDTPTTPTKPSTPGSSSSSGSTTITTTVKVQFWCSACSGNTNNNNNTIIINPSPKPEEPDKPNKPSEPDKPEEPDKPTVPEKKAYYEHIRYGKWQDGKGYGSNVQNMRFPYDTYNYCLPTKETIYTTSYATKVNGQTYSYTLRFKNLYAQDLVGNVTVSNRSNFLSLSDYQAYMNTMYNKPIEMVGATGKGDASIPNVYVFRDASLKYGNFSYDISNAYQSGSSYYVNVNVRPLNLNGVSSAYRDLNLGYSVYFVPLKFDVTYTLKRNCKRDAASKVNTYTRNGYIYTDKQTEYEWMHRTYEYKWSTEKNLGGDWEWTGNVEYR